jgi:hypothetical protein
MVCVTVFLELGGQGFTGVVNSKYVKTLFTRSEAETDHPG